MDSKPQSPPPDDAETKPVLRKPSNDVASRKYRRRSPSSGSSSSHGSPKREHGSSPTFPKGGLTRTSEHEQRRREDEKELDRDFGRSRYGRSGDSYRHSSRNSHSYSGHDDYSRYEKRTDGEGRHYHASSNYGRESKSGIHSDLAREESDRGRSKDYMRNVDKYSRDRYDSSRNRSKDKERELLSLHQKFKDRSSPDRIMSGQKHANSTFEDKDRDRHRRDRDDKRDYQRNFGDHKSDRTIHHEESRGYRNDSSGRDDGHRLRESHENDPKELSGPKERKKLDNRDNSKSRTQQIEDKPILGSENRESSAKKPKLFRSEKDTDYSKDSHEKQSPSSKPTQEIDAKVTVDQAHSNDADAATDLNAAKVAAMKAAELVNRNLVGGGFMSTEQKKKLLWGNKKSTTSEECGHRWDTSLFGDRERQEKFNKLMGVKGEIVEHKVNSQDGNGQLQADRQKELQLDLEKQYTAGLRRRDGRTVGLGL